LGGQQNARFATVLTLFGLSLFALVALCFGFALNSSPVHLSVAGLLALITSLTFWLVSIWFAQINDEDSVCWEALHQSLVAWRQAIREQSDERAQSLYRQGKGSLSLAQAIEPTCQQLQQVLRQLASHAESVDNRRSEISFGLGVLHALNPYAVPSVRLAVWVQTLWQVWMVIASILGAFAGWLAVTSLPLRALVYAAGGGILGASLYNLRTLADHIAVQRDYSTRFWVDYLTRPLLGGILGVVVYAFTVGLAWTLTLQSPVGAQMPKVIFALGFLSGYALRSVLTWLNGVAKTIFRPAPSPSQEQTSFPEEQR